MAPTTAAAKSSGGGKKVRKPHRNTVLTPGVLRFGRSKMYHKKGLWAKRTVKVAKQVKDKKPLTVEKKIKGDKNGGTRRVQVVKSKRFHGTSRQFNQDGRRKYPQRPHKLRRSLTPGTVCILLAGRHVGKRVVFLKQLASGLILVTGPFKINGVPLRRVNQSTVIPTSHRVDLAGVKSDHVADDYFTRSKVKTQKKSEETFFAAGSTEVSEEEKKRLADKKKTQSDLDTALLASIKKTEFLRQYLKTRFTITNRMRPHELIF